MSSLLKLFKAAGRTERSNAQGGSKGSNRRAASEAYSDAAEAGSFIGTFKRRDCKRSSKLDSKPDTALVTQRGAQTGQTRLATLRRSLSRLGRSFRRRRDNCGGCSATSASPGAAAVACDGFNTDDDDPLDPPVAAGLLTTTPAGHDDQDDIKVKIKIKVKVKDRGKVRSKAKDTDKHKGSANALCYGDDGMSQRKPNHVMKSFFMRFPSLKRRRRGASPGSIGRAPATSVLEWASADIANVQSVLRTTVASASSTSDGGTRSYRHELQLPLSTASCLQLLGDIRSLTSASFNLFNASESDESVPPTRQGVHETTFAADIGTLDDEAISYQIGSTEIDNAPSLDMLLEARTNNFDGAPSLDMLLEARTSNADGAPSLDMMLEARASNVDEAPSLDMLPEARSSNDDGEEKRSSFTATTNGSPCVIEETASLRPVTEAAGADEEAGCAKSDESEFSSDATTDIKINAVPREDVIEFSSNDVTEADPKAVQQFREVQELSRFRAVTATLPQRETTVISQTDQAASDRSLKVSRSADQASMASSIEVSVNNCYLVLPPAATTPANIIECTEVIDWQRLAGDVECEEVYPDPETAITLAEGDSACAGQETSALLNDLADEEELSIGQDGPFEMIVSSTEVFNCRRDVSEDRDVTVEDFQSAVTSPNSLASAFTMQTEENAAKVANFEADAKEECREVEAEVDAKVEQLADAVVKAEANKIEDNTMYDIEDEIEPDANEKESEQHSVSASSPSSVTSLSYLTSVSSMPSDAELESASVAMKSSVYIELFEHPPLKTGLSLPVTEPTQLSTFWRSPKDVEHVAGCGEKQPDNIQKLFVSFCAFKLQIPPRTVVQVSPPRAQTETHTNTDDITITNVPDVHAQLLIETEEPACVVMRD